MALGRSPAVTWICAVAVAVLAVAVTVVAIPGFAQAPSQPSAQAPSQPSPPSSPAAAEPPVCVKCHKEAWEGFSQTRHAVRGDARTPFGTGRDCQACHGDASEHLKNPAKNPIPQRFLKGTPASAKSGVCLTCHGGDRHLTFWESGRHRKNDVACNNCHNVHAAPHRRASRAAPQRYATITLRDDDRSLEYKTCGTCHKQIRSARAQELAPPDHRRQGQVLGLPQSARRALARDGQERDGEPALPHLHVDKRGPYVLEHPPVEENCLTCHHSHGSRTTSCSPTRCRSSARTATTGRGIPAPSTTAARAGSVRHPGEPNTRFIARSCLNCHSSIHGSNAPANRGQFFLR